MAKRPRDPDAIQMSFGDHLEELRRRLIYALSGVGIIMLVTFIYARDIILWLCEPLLEVQREAHLPEGVYNFSALVGFTAYMKVALVAALIIAAPWVIYQLWKFIEAGLYAAERRVFVLMAPFSAALTAVSVLFLYYIMLPAMLAFLIQFSTTYPMGAGGNRGFLPWVTHKFMHANESLSSLGGFNLAAKTHPGAATQPAQGPTFLQTLPADPATPAEGQVWLNTTDGQLKVYLAGLPRVINLTSGTLMTPMIGIGEYLSLVLGTALVIVATFQIPVVMGALSASGLVAPSTLARWRLYVFAGVFVLGLFITPSQDLFSDVAIPLLMYALFEVGLLLMRILWRRQSEESPA